MLKLAMTIKTDDAISGTRGMDPHGETTYRKIPKISPSKYKPPKLIAQKTLR